ncbi:MAG TPA: hypothetical protein VHM30_17185 [Gemmatimonadaceae bacterium]|nr:hypothetical protein [Gemmatimonadaceae bacterium]
MRNAFSLAFLLALTAAPLAAQNSCPQADSALGPKTNGYVKVKYDDFADSSSVEGAPEGDLTMTSDAGDAIISFASRFPGKKLRDTAAVELKVVLITASSRDGTLARDAKVDMGMAKYRDVAEARFLVDDSVRLSLPVKKHSATIRPGDTMYPAFLLETLTFVATLNDLARIGRGESAIIRVGDVQKKFPGRVLKSFREQARYLMCAKAAE